MHLPSIRPDRAAPVDSHSFAAGKSYCKMTVGPGAGMRDSSWLEAAQQGGVHAVGWESRDPQI